MLGIPTAIGAIFSFLGGLAPSISSYFVAKSNADVSMYHDQSTAEVAAAQANTQAAIATNTMKVANNTQTAAHVMIYAFGLPPAIHMGMIFLTAAFEPWLPAGIGIHEVSATFTDIESKIALSFFILAPSMAVITAFRK